MAYLNILQGELVFVKHPIPTRQGWYQKLRMDNSKVRYVKVFPPVPDHSNVVYNPHILEDSNSNRYCDGTITKIVKGGDNVARFIRAGFQERCVPCNLVQDLEFEEITLEMDKATADYISRINDLITRLETMKKEYTSREEDL